jgi:Flp pilus assembly protein TadG
MISRIRRRWLRLLREERGSATLWLVVGMVPLVGFAALAVDVGTIAVAKAKLQRAAEAGAHAGAKAMRDGEGTAAEARARQVLLDNTGAMNAIPEAKVGSYDQATGSFTPGIGPDGVPALEVRASAVVPLVFAPMVGIQNASFDVEAVYGGRKREVVIVQDVSGSFTQEIGDAKNADQALVQQMSDQGLPGDQVGIVTFGSSAATERGLSRLETQTAAVLGTIASIQVRTCGSNRNCGNATRTDLGIQQAIELFQFSDPAETERVIIVVTDGDPTGTANVQLLAENTADDADALGIHIFTMLLNTSANAQASANNAALVRGAGTPFETSDPDSLEDLLLQILAALPLLLVH